MTTIYINGVAQVVIHSFERHTDVTRYKFLPANEGYAEDGVPGHHDNYAIVEGAANLDEPIVYFTMKVPDGFVSFTSVMAIWGCPTAEANMVWTLFASYAACGEVYTTDTDEPEMGLTASGGTNIINCQVPANALTLANLAAGDILGLTFIREGSDGADTLDAKMQFYGLLFTYVGHQ